MNYSKTKIYKIWSPLGDDIYIGSTTQTYLSQRMTSHRNKYKLWINKKYALVRSFELFDNYGVDNCYIELLEQKECTTKDEKNKLEGGYIRSMNCVNKNITGRTQKEYYETNKEQIKIKKKKYHESNKEKRKEYYESNKEKIKEYYESNKEQIKEKIKEYYESNKEKIKEYKKEYNKKYRDSHKK